MANLNKVLLMGNLTREPQSKALQQNGNPICDMSMAVNRRYKTQTGEEREDVVYVDLITYGHQADYCVKNMVKGSTVYVEGHLRYDTWQDKETGKNRSKLRVVIDTILLLDRKTSQPIEPQPYPNNGYGMPQQPYPPVAYGQPAPNYGFQQQSVYPSFSYQPAQQPYQAYPQPAPRQVVPPQPQPARQQPPSQPSGQPATSGQPETSEQSETSGQSGQSEQPASSDQPAHPSPSPPPPQPDPPSPVPPPTIPSQESVQQGDEEVVDDMPF